MANKKKQHFVPQFFLRHFSIPENRILINLYDRKNDKMVLGVPISSQAQESYYYGNDGVFEDYLSKIESDTATIIKKIINTHGLPERYGQEHKDLLKFVNLFNVRTKAKVGETDRLINSLFQTLIKYDPNLPKEKFENLRLTHKEPPAWNLTLSMYNWLLAWDLNACILINKTKKKFFTSDNPLIIYNPFMIDRKQYWAAKAMIGKGLIYLLPISPECCLMFYDSWAYSLNSAKKTLIELKKPSDVFYINMLQSVSCDRVLYFSDTSNSKYLRSLAKEGLKSKKDKFVQEEFLDINHENKKPILTYYLEHTLKFRFSFLQETIYAKEYDYASKIDHPRNPELVELATLIKERKLDELLKY